MKIYWTHKWQNSNDYKKIWRNHSPLSLPLFFYFSFPRSISLIPPVTPLSVFDFLPLSHVVLTLIPSHKYQCHSLSQISHGSSLIPSKISLYLCIIPLNLLPLLTHITKSLSILLSRQTTRSALNWCDWERREEGFDGVKPKSRFSAMWSALLASSAWVSLDHTS
jgi:hypothetical protein